MAPKAAAAAVFDTDPLYFLVNDAASFLQRHWERKPAVMRATAARKSAVAGLFGWGELQRLAAICDEEGQPLEFGVDVNAARYVDGRRETPNGEVADAGTLQRLYRKEGCTMQVHQPQRFSDELWRLLAALEGQLGCLVGCNAYLTPAGTQGLAPHWDDVEIFVVQTQGSKRWRLYSPCAPPADADADACTARARLLASSHLANQVSGDLLESEIGQPTMEFTLQVGDVLYMPRGCIHQAAAQEGDSAHLTISTYQRWSFADLLQHAVALALASSALQPLLPQPLKAGLPLRWLSAASMNPADAAQLAAASGGFGDALPAVLAQAGQGTKAGRSSKAVLARQLAGACRAMAEWLEDEELGPRVVEAAADAVMAEDFMRSRLPPHPVQLPPHGPAPTLDDAVQCVGADFFRLVPLSGSGSKHAHDGSGSDCEEEHGHGHHVHSAGEACGAGCAEAGHNHGCGGGAPPAWVRLVSCLQNDRASHMMGGAGDEESDCDEDQGSSDDEDGEGGSEAELEEDGDEASDVAASGSDDDDSKGGDMQAQLQRLAAEAGAKRTELKAMNLPSSDEDGEEEGTDGEEGQDEGGSGDDVDKEPEDLVFPAEFAPALVQLLGSGAGASSSDSRPVPVSQIALPGPELQLQVAVALWDAGVLCTVKAPAKQRKQKQKSTAKQGKKQHTGGKDAAAAGGSKKQAAGHQPTAAGSKPKKQRRD